MLWWPPLAVSKKVQARAERGEEETQEEEGGARQGSCAAATRGMHDLGRTRACSPRFRRPMPYPLGHEARCWATNCGLARPSSRCGVARKPSWAAAAFFRDFLLFLLEVVA